MVPRTGYCQQYEEHMGTVKPEHGRAGFQPRNICLDRSPIFLSCSLLVMLGRMGVKFIVWLDFRQFSTRTFLENKYL